MMTEVSRLKIVDGEIVMKDGSNLKTYLTEWQNKAKYGDFDINIIFHKQLLELQRNQSYGWAA